MDGEERAKAPALYSSVHTAVIRKMIFTALKNLKKYFKESLKGEIVE